MNHDAIIVGAGPAGLITAATIANRGFDVIVFIPSKEEDESRITCGNAILAGTLPEVPYHEEPGVAVFRRIK